MTFESRIERIVVELIVQKYKKRQHELQTDTSAFVCDMSISFRELLNSLPGKYSFGKKNGDLCYRMDLDIKKQSAIVNVKERTRIINNYSLPFQIELLQAIIFLKMLEENNLIIVINNFRDVEELHSFDGEERGFFVYIQDERIEKYIKYFLYSDIIPSTTLIEIYNNKFETEDKRRYKGQRCISWIAIIVSVLIGLASIFISIYKDIKIDKFQYNELINKMECINNNILDYGQTENAKP